MDSLQAQIADLETELTDVKAERDKYRKDLSKNRAYVADLLSKTEEQGSKLKDMQRRLDRLQGHMTPATATDVVSDPRKRIVDAENANDQRKEKRARTESDLRPMHLPSPISPTISSSKPKSSIAISESSSTTPVKSSGQNATAPTPLNTAVSPSIVSTRAAQVNTGCATTSRPTGAGTSTLALGPAATSASNVAHPSTSIPPTSLPNRPPTSIPAQKLTSNDLLATAARSSQPSTKPRLTPTSTQKQSLTPASSPLQFTLLQNLSPSTMSNAPRPLLDNNKPNGRSAGPSLTTTTPQAQVQVPASPSLASMSIPTLLQTRPRLAPALALPTPSSSSSRSLPIPIPGDLIWQRYGGAVRPNVTFSPAKRDRIHVFVTPNNCPIWEELWEAVAEAQAQTQTRSEMKGTPVVVFYEDREVRDHLYWDRKKDKKDKEQGQGGADDDGKPKSKLAELDQTGSTTVTLFVYRHMAMWDYAGEYEFCLRNGVEAEELREAGMDEEDLRDFMARWLNSRNKRRWMDEEDVLSLGKITEWQIDKALGIKHNIANMRFKYYDHLFADDLQEQLIIQEGERRFNSFRPGDGWD